MTPFQIWLTVLLVLIILVLKPTRFLLLSFIKGPLPVIASAFVWLARHILDAHLTLFMHLFMPRNVAIPSLKREDSVRKE